MSVLAFPIGGPERSFERVVGHRLAVPVIPAKAGIQGVFPPLHRPFRWTLRTRGGAAGDHPRRCPRQGAFIPSRGDPLWIPAKPVPEGLIGGGNDGRGSDHAFAGGDGREAQSLGVWRRSEACLSNVPLGLSDPRSFKIRAAAEETLILQSSIKPPRYTPQSDLSARKVDHWLEKT